MEYVGHPMQMGVTVLFIMALCGVAGFIMPYHGAAAAWMFFAAFFIMVFGIFMPANYVHSRCHKRRY